jgi:hypothetical protein
MTETAVQAIKKIEKISKSVFWTMIALIILLGLTYMYFINKTIWNVAAREKMQDEIVTINSQLGEKEFEYIKSKGSITMESAKQLGFDQPARVSFVTKEILKTVAMR